METAANSGSLVDQRDAAGKFVPGHEKLGGKKKGATFATRAREAMEAADSPERFSQIINLLWGIVTLADDPKDRMAAAKLLMEWAGVNAPKQFEVGNLETVFGALGIPLQGTRDAAEI